LSSVHTATEPEKIQAHSSLGNVPNATARERFESENLLQKFCPRVLMDTSKSKDSNCYHRSTEDMPLSESQSEAHSYNQRIWNKDRRPWDGDVGSVELIRRAMWKSVYQLSDSRSRGYTASEVRAASLLVALEALNHGAAELGFGNPYDQKRVEIGANKLYESWIEMKTPTSLRTEKL